MGYEDHRPLMFPSLEWWHQGQRMQIQWDEDLFAAFFRVLIKVSEFEGCGGFDSGHYAIGMRPGEATQRTNQRAAVRIMSRLCELAGWSWSPETNILDCTPLLPFVCIDPNAGGPPLPSRVYFIQAGESGLIKIGKADDPTARLATMQTGSADRLVLLTTMSGGRREEHALHRRFAHLRRSGEWFEPAADLLSFINELRRPAI